MPPKMGDPERKDALQTQKQYGGSSKRGFSALERQKRGSHSPKMGDPERKSALHTPKNIWGFIKRGVSALQTMGVTFTNIGSSRKKVCTAHSKKNGDSGKKGQKMAFQKKVPFFHSMQLSKASCKALTCIVLYVHVHLFLMR